MNQNIINSLVQCKQDFDASYEEFAFKQDLEAVFEHEYRFYLSPLCEKIVPAIVKELKSDSKSRITDFFPYIVPKYHDIIKKEVADYEKNSLNMVKNMGKSILETFLKDLMAHSRATDQEKEKFLNKFFKDNLSSFNILMRNDPLYGLTVCAKLRNPKIQNSIINTYNHELKSYINSQSQEQFDKDIIPLFAYPLDGKIENYYNKWIAKELLHVKFSKSILGKYYEYAKKMTKENEKLRRQSSK